MQRTQKIKKRNFAVVLGARPNFVKAAPFFREAKRHPEFKFTLIHTGQHFDDSMSKIFFDEMSIPRPDIQLDIRGEFHTEKIGKMFSALRSLFSKRKFDGVIVFGDINSTLAGAVAAAKHTKLIHVESGLRSHDRRMPEEINRAIVDHLSDMLFTTEPVATRNLIQEGISRKKIKFVGNIMIESIETFSEHIDKSMILDTLGLKSREYIVSTIHRVENTDSEEILEKLLKLLQSLARVYRVVFPLHPGTRKKIEQYEHSHLLRKLNVIEPLGYFEFLKLVKESRGIVTDSGGIQEETSHLGIPCCTLRDNTERPVTLEVGSNKLFPIDLIDPKNCDDIIAHIERRDFKQKHIPLWDDGVSRRIFSWLKKY